MNPGPEGAGPDLDSIVEQILGAPRLRTRQQTATAAGVSLEQARRLWRAMGFADVGEGVEFTDSDLTALRLAFTLVDRGGWTTETILDVARAVGQTTARLADWQLDTLTRLLASDGRYDSTAELSLETGAALRRELGVILPVMERLLVHGWRRQLAAAFERGLTAPPPGDTQVLTIGFADLVGYTRLVRRLEVSRVAELVARFESRAADLMAQRGVRVIKTLGDEVMVAAADAARVAAALLDLQHAQVVDPETATLRIGVATGQVVARRGDIFGAAVNLASRLAGSADPGSLLVDERTAVLLAPLDQFQAVAQPERQLPGLGAVRSWTLTAPSVARRRVG